MHMNVDHGEFVSGDFPPHGLFRLRVDEPADNQAARSRPESLTSKAQCMSPGRTKGRMD